MRPVRQPSVDVEAAADAAARVVEMHAALADWLRVGMTLARIDRFVAESLQKMGARSCFHRYKVGKHPPFPSHACLSVNDCVVHGTAGSYTAPLKPGDLLKIDIGVTYRGWIGDAAWTYAIGEPSETDRRLMDTGKESIARAVETLRPGNKLIEWARSLQAFVEEERGFHLVRGLGGHGYGRSLHAPPYISNTVPTFDAEWPDAHERVRSGWLLAVEPMIAVGTGRVVQDGNNWPLTTADGSQSVHYEHDVLVTPDGPRLLTAGLDDLRDEITR